MPKAQPALDAQRVQPKPLKRVTQACTRCKIKKVRCCGSTPCSRCEADDAVCCFGARSTDDGKLVSKSHVDRLHLQQKILVSALNAMWQKHEKPHLPADAEDLSVHEIVAGTGVLREGRNADVFANFDEPSPTKTNDYAFPMHTSPDVIPPTASDANQNFFAVEDLLVQPHAADQMTDLPYLSPDQGLTSDDLTSAAAQSWIDPFSMPTSPHMPPNIQPMDIDAAKSTKPQDPRSLAQRRGASWLNKCQMPPYINLDCFEPDASGD